MVMVTAAAPSHWLSGEKEAELSNAQTLMHLL